MSFAPTSELLWVQLASVGYIYCCTIARKCAIIALALANYDYALLHMEAKSTGISCPKKQPTLFAIGSFSICRT